MLLFEMAPVLVLVLVLVLVSARRLAHVFALV